MRFISYRMHDDIIRYARNELIKNNIMNQSDKKKVSLAQSADAI